MKHLFLIEKSADVLRTVKSYLEEDNIPYTKFSSLEDALLAKDLPALIIFFASDSYTEIRHDIALLKNNASFSRISRILILPFNTSVIASKVEELDIQALFQIPVDRLKFHTSVAQLLRRGPRRVFRIVISIQAEGKNIRYAGVSIDFSEGGMAFECPAEFLPGDRIQVQFVNPRNRRRFLLRTVVIRRVVTPAGNTIFYGVKFTDMNDKDTQELLDFIAGEKSSTPAQGTGHV